MATCVIAVLLALLLLFAAKSALKHFHGESGCCGGSAAPAAPKVTDATMTETITLEINGMHCENCAARLEAALNKLDGVSARVSFAEKNAVIRARSKDQLAQICSVISREGFSPAARTCI